MLGQGQGLVKAPAGRGRLGRKHRVWGRSMLSTRCIWLMDEERLADLGALLVFRHWLRQQLAELAGEEAVVVPPCDPAQPEARYGRLFF